MKPCWRTIKPKVLSICLLAALALNQGCKDDDRSLGLSLREDGGNINTFVRDSFEIITRTIREDSVRTDSLSRNLIGAILDPVTGLRSAAVCFDFALPEINIDFGTVNEPDSVVLTLLFDPSSGYYGEFETVQRFEVRRLTQRIYSSEQYYSTFKPSTGELLAEVNAVFNFKDTVRWKENGVAKYAVGALRIPLSREFGKILTDPANQGNYSGNDAFRNFFNGIALIPKTDHLTEGKGGIAALDLLKANSKLIVHYGDSLSKEFLINSTCARIGSYESSYTPLVSGQFNQGAIRFPETYVQALGGLKTKIEIRGLFDLVESGTPVLINEAKLTLHIKDGSLSTQYPAPERLLLLQPNASDSGNTFILDLIDEIAPPSPLWVGNTNYGGKFNSAQNTYTFRINRHIQQLLDDYLEKGIKNERGYYLIVPTDLPVTPARAILDHGNSISEPAIELKITYIKL